MLQEWLLSNPQSGCQKWLRPRCAPQMDWQQKCLQRNLWPKAAMKRMGPWPWLPTPQSSPWLLPASLPPPTTKGKMQGTMQATILTTINFTVQREMQRIVVQCSVSNAQFLCTPQPEMSIRIELLGEVACCRFQGWLHTGRCDWVGLQTGSGSADVIGWASGQAPPRDV